MLIINEVHGYDPERCVQRRCGEILRGKKDFPQYYGRQTINSHPSRSLFSRAQGSTKVVIIAFLPLTYQVNHHIR